MPDSSITGEYQKVGDRDASKEKTAHVADELYQRAKKIAISGGSSMTKRKLVDALNHH